MKYALLPLHLAWATVWALLCTCIAFYFLLTEGYDTAFRSLK